MEGTQVSNREYTIPSFDVAAQITWYCIGKARSLATLCRMNGDIEGEIKALFAASELSERLTELFYERPDMWDRMMDGIQANAVDAAVQEYEAGETMSLEDFAAQEGIDLEDKS